MTKTTPALTAGLLLAAASGLWAGEPASSSATPSTVVEPSSGSTSIVGDSIRPCLCHGAFAGSADKPFVFNLTVGYDSSYFCRGLDIGDDLVHGTATVDYRPVEWLTWTGSFRYHDVTDVDFTEIFVHRRLAHADVGGI